MRIERMTKCFILKNKVQVIVLRLFVERERLAAVADRVELADRVFHGDQRRYLYSKVRL
jgi:hypothetical protein